MKEIFDVEDMQLEAQTVKCDEEEIWVNLHDGRFVLRDSIHWKRPIVRSVRAVYPFVLSVMNQGCVIAKKEKGKHMLRRLSKPKRIDYLV